LNCDYCGPLYFPDEESLQWHLRVHHGETLGR
jgi:hypothetical protein